MRRLKHIILGFRNWEGGQSTVEFVVVVPFLFLIFFLIVDFGWLFKNWIVVTNAAREATRCAAVDTCDPDPYARQQIVNGLGSNVFDGLEIDINYVEGNGIPGIQRGDSVVVCIEAPNEFISPVMPFLSIIAGGSTISDTIPLRARNEMRLEQTPGSDPPASGPSCNFD